MAIDNKLTQEIADWLNTQRDQRDIEHGALMLLKLNNNRFLYANIMRRPDKYADKVEYELRKHLRIRLDNMTNADVVRLEAKVIPAAKRTLASPPAVVSTDAELPKANVARGRRADHDRLPAEVQALWDKNFTLYQTIKDLFERLKAMEKAQPCDRYEYLKLLDDADKQYRANLESYDNYVAPSAPSASSPTSTAAKAKSPTENAEDSTSRDTDYRKINAARKTLSKYKKVFANAIEQGDTEKAATAKKKVLDSVDAIRSAGGVVGAAVTNELVGLGILMR